MRLLPASSVLVLAVACGGNQGLSTHNASPEAAITSHGDGDRVYEGVPVTLRGTLSDPDDQGEDLTAVWYNGDVQACTALADENGATSCEFTFGLTDGRVVLEAYDLDDAAGSDTVTVEVVASNPPSVEIFSPEPVGRYYTGSLIRFEGITDDAEDVHADLTGWWESNVDGELGAVGFAPDGSGITVGFGTLSEGQHAITLSVMDTTGSVGRDDVIIDVGAPNTPPDCEILTPLSGTEVIAGSPILFEATAADVDVPANMLAAEFESDVNGVLGSATPTSSGDILFNASGLTNGIHIVSLTVTDDAGATCSDAVSLTVSGGNTAPVLADLTLAPSDPMTGDTLTCTPGLVTDPDVGDVVTLTYAWTVNGSDAGVSGSTLTAGPRDDVVSCAATPNDGSVDGLTVDSSTSTVINTPPQFSLVTFSPSAVDSTTDVTAMMSGWFDADGDPENYTFAWTVASTPLTAITGATMPAANYDTGNVVEVTVTADDTFDTGSQLTASLTVGAPPNTPPTLAGAAITPDPAFATDTLTCVGLGWNDADGDLDQSTVSWTVQGVPAGTGPTLSSGFVAGNLVECTITPFDGTDTGPPVSDSLTISTPANTAPSVAWADITPDPAYDSDTLTCNWGGYNDVDGDPDQSIVTWRISGSAVGSGPTLSGVFNAGDWVRCVVSPFDGTDYGTNVIDNIQISAGANNPPSIAWVDITPDPAYVSDTLTCNWGGWNDLDGDPDLSTVQWRVNGLNAGTGLTLSSGFAVGDTVECEVTPDDGTDTGPPLSDSLVISLQPLVGADCLLGVQYTRIIHTQGNVDFDQIIWAPDGSYALITAYPSDLYLYDPATETITLEAAGGSEYWYTMEMAPDGAFALIGGASNGTSSAAPVLYEYTVANGLQPITNITGIASGKLTNVARVRDITHRPGTDEYAILADNAGSWPSQITYLHLFEPDFVGGSHLWDYEGGVNTSQGAGSIDWGTNLGQQVAVGNSIYTELLFYDPNIASPILTSSNPAGYSNMSKTVFNPADRSVGWIHNWSSNKIYTWNGVIDRDFSWGLNPNGWTARDFVTTDDGHWRMFVGQNGRVWLSDSPWYPIDTSKIYPVEIPGWNSPPYSGGTSDSLTGVGWKPGTCEGLIVGDSTSGQGLLVKFEMPN